MAIYPEHLHTSSCKFESLHLFKRGFVACVDGFQNSFFKLKKPVEIKKMRWNSYADHIQCLTTAICNDKKILKIVTFFPLTNVLFHLMRKTLSQHANVRTGSKYFSVIVATHFSFAITLFCLLKLYVNISFYFFPNNCLFFKQNP